MRRLIVLLSLLALLFALASTTLAQNPGETTHVVQPGENLFRISLRYNVSMASIASRNNIANLNLIYVGQTLIIPAGGTTNPPPATAAPGVTPTPPPPSTSTYTVQRGDTLGSIARRFNTTIQSLASLNNIANPNLIYAGQVLRVDGSAPAPTPAPGSTAVPVPTSSAPVAGGFELGGHVFSFSYPAQMRGAGMTWAKTQIRWDGSAPPSVVQGAIDAARSKGFKILLGIVGSTQQLAANPTQYYQNFANFLAGVARLNPDGIEVWNEPNINREWPAGRINGANYTQMLSAAYSAIKGANSNVLVISGAPAPTGFFGGRCANDGCDDDIFIRQMAQAGAANYMDCVGIHYNEGIVAPNQTSGDPRGNSGHYSRYYQSMVNLYSSVFPSRPLCFTEIGYLTPEGLGPLPAGFAWAANVTAQNQAVWLAQAVTLARNSRRVRLFIIWNVDSTNYGDDPQAGFAIIRPNNTCSSCVTLGAAMGVQ
ncbi:MAG: LysM peptidoglycan-binding domain-containing protein [Anaerolineae bacterium]|nr:LysM peptidoglycan-binding domain-containing protein [Anaerolineae bacterium]MBN8619389.1 LysM peptidoglycan-binding domain-containing protein [Anaerolineae bacterium]